MFNSMQEAYDAVVDHLEKQGKRAVGYNTHRKQNVCLYLTECNTKCAVGAFIPDGHEAQQSEGDASIILDEYPDLYGVLGIQALSNLDTREFWLNIQRCHDSSNNALELNGHLAQIAKRYKLTSRTVTNWEG